MQARRQLAGFLVASGSVLAVCGVVMSATQGSIDVEQPMSLAAFNLRGALSACVLLIGLSAALVGSVIWGTIQVTKTLKTLGSYVLVFSVLGLFTTPLNVHNWTVTLAFVYVTALLISVIFLAGC